jgi:hypothetical protein
MVNGVTGHLIPTGFLARRLRAAEAVPSHAFIRALKACRHLAAPLGPAVNLRTMLERGAEPLVDLLGFEAPTDVHQDQHAIAATLPGVCPVALVVTTWGESLDSWWRPAIVESRRRGADWCLLFNGVGLRLIDARRVYSRRYVEVDLDAAADETDAAAALWVLCAARGLSVPPGAVTSVGQLITAAERYGADVCRGLRDGVLHASQGMLQALFATGPRHPADVVDTFEQALTIVYRVLFLLFAEARSLVPMWHPVYRQGYSIEALRETAERHPHPPGLWDAFRAVSKLAHHGCRTGSLRVAAFNGRLFAPSRTPLADRRHVDNRAMRDAVLALTTRPAIDGGGRERIAYSDLGVEQLGAVYETLLDYEPRLAGASVSLQPGSDRRKQTGTFYTPQPLAQFLVRRTLAPLIEGASPQQILALRVLDPAMGSGAFLVAACEYLAHAYEAALVAQGGCHASDFGPREHASIRRTIAERCIYGVDLNPMAVQLGRLSLWLQTLAADRPLTFLDHHLQCGDSLVGAWLATLRHAPGMRRGHRTAESLPLFDTPALGEALRHALPARFALALAAADTVEQVREKERILTSLARPDGPLAKWRRVADLWCAAWFAGARIPPNAFGALSDTILTGASSLAATTSDALIRIADETARARRFFHWELEFPEVFFDDRGARLWRGGFDAVLGNPPWDMIRADSGAAAQRDRVRTDAHAFVRFTRDSGVYAAQSDGHANRYQLFLERAIHLTRPGGRIGLVLPGGVTADHGSGKLRRALFAQCAVDAVVGFDNRKGVFPIHRSLRFVLLTATNGTPTDEIACRLGERDPAALEAASADADRSWFPVRVTPAMLERLTGSELALPELTSPTDLAIAERAASLYLPLADASGWNARFGRELNASDDRPHFQDRGRGLPIVEGKQIDPFHVHVAASRWAIAPGDADRFLGARHRRWRVAYRDVASATNKMTLIAAMLPPATVTTHTVFCLRTPLPRHVQYFLCGLFNSFVVNYLVRLRVATHVTTAIVERLPIPTFAVDPEVSREIAEIAAALSNHGTDLERLARLNALAAELFQLSEPEFAHVLATFPLVPIDQRDAALQAFRARRRQ